MKRLFTVVLVFAMMCIAGVALAQNQKANPTHSIDLSTATRTTDNVVNAGAVSTSTGTVQRSTSTVNVTTPPPGSIPGSGGRPAKSAPPPSPTSKK
ncbi:MAG: hypothetical protein C0392_03060 [Syntrophus sp. (in: bacteria)]|nr:hypothetical protein [Syntrophus sp. (in: bacteria)]